MTKTAWSRVARAFTISIILSFLPACSLSRRPVENSTQSEKSSHEPQIIFLKENDCFPEENLQGSVKLGDNEIAQFRAEWNRSAPRVVEQLSAGRLATVARSPIKNDGRAISLDQLRTMPLRPITASSDRTSVAFSLGARESTIDVGAQLMIVKRRLIVAALYDPQTRSITKIYVTIRGWAED
ncbi:MAG TPA: hypothetical protein VMV81_07365 [Phycisphaerae bacterium]|nr:hypothetical protein [Phycisphaerae bacterium]